MTYDRAPKRVPRLSPVLTYDRDPPKRVPVYPRYLEDALTRLVSLMHLFPPEGEACKRVADRTTKHRVPA
jgi:hypothetical protein